ncbi:MAG: carbon monoxide dehydrogenase, partial [Rhodobacterales bacterium]
VSGFIAHLREHGFRLGVAETETALRALSCVNPIVPSEARLALKSVCAGSVEDSVQFDMLFDSFWMADGRVRHKVIQIKATAELKDTKSTRTDETQSTAGKGSIEAPEDAKDGEDSYAEGTGKLVASKTQNLMKKDLCELVSAEDIRVDRGRSTASGQT